MASYPLLAFAIFLVAFEFQNLLSWGGRRTIKPGLEKSQDFTIVVPVFGHPRYFEGERLLRYRHRVLVAMEISAPLMAGFADEDFARPRCPQSPPRIRFASTLTP